MKKTISTLDDGKCRGVFVATQRRSYSFGALSLAWPTSQRMLLLGIEKHSTASMSKCNEHKVWKSACKLYVTLMTELKKQVVCVSN